MNSRGEVGPGNCAESWYTMMVSVLYLPIKSHSQVSGEVQYRSLEALADVYSQELLEERLGGTLSLLSLEVERGIAHIPCSCPTPSTVMSSSL
jgi:hypothetical protein